MGPDHGKQPQHTSAEALTCVGRAGCVESSEAPILTQGARVQQRTPEQTQKAPQGPRGISL